MRHYWRGARSRLQREQRRRAIAELGAACLEALAACRTPEDFEVIFRAIVDGLVPRDEPRF